MPVVDVMDDTFLRASRPQVRGWTETSWTSWLPDLVLVVAEDRGDRGVRWTATATRLSGTRLSGTAEVWLEEVPGGTLAHLYVRLDPSAGQEGGSRRHAQHLPDQVRRTWKRGLHAWKDSQEGDRST